MIAYRLHKKNVDQCRSLHIMYMDIVWLASLDPRPSDLCILMEGLVRTDHVG